MQEESHHKYRIDNDFRLCAGAESKELLIVEGANHVDLYDPMDKIPFDKLTGFFRENLA